MAPQLKEMTVENNQIPMVDTTPMKDSAPSVATPATEKSSLDQKSPSSVKSTISLSSSSRGSVSRGMGMKRPSLVFDVDDLELCMALQEVAPAFIEKMNGSYPEIVKAYSMVYGDHPSCMTETESAIITGLDRDGFVLDVTLKTNGNKDMAAVLKDIRVPYQGKVKSADDLEAEAESMYKQACDKLGYMYKAQNGYYTKAAKEGVIVTYNAANQGLINTYVLASQGLLDTYKAAVENPMKATAVTVGFMAVSCGVALGYKTLKNKK